MYMLFWQLFLMLFLVVSPFFAAIGLEYYETYLEHKRKMK
jgi:hypothetical protein